MTIHLEAGDALMIVDIQRDFLTCCMLVMHRDFGMQRGRT